ncbi:hypothetical protein DFQ27_007937 [Actinomortierella ambigua]|uniref:Uncharacterized protein n=1 Tax=Actinomortierella ambigua TaxID=1343610 RepID=A0A9P6PRQ3_9FUNG|nr:hypothetical protein DFQ27_007937 [Actinomortierella ambigua]
MARQASLQELLSQPGKGTGNRPRRAKNQAPPKDYDEDQALRWAIEESLKDAGSPKGENGGARTPMRTGRPSRDIAELESRPWQPDNAHGSRGEDENDQEAPESDDEDSIDLRRSSNGRERSRSVQPISMVTTAASCLFKAPSPRRRSALFGAPPSNNIALEVMSSDPEEDELEDLELVRAPTTSRLSSTTGRRALSSQFPRSRGLHRRPPSTIASSQRHKTQLGTSQKSLAREAIDISVLSSDDGDGDGDGDHLMVGDTSNDVDELSRGLSLDAFTDKAPSRKSGYPTAEDIVAVRPSPSLEPLDLEGEAGTASMPWTLSAERDVVLDTPQKQRIRNYEMILDSEEDCLSEDSVLVSQEPWPLPGRHVNVHAKHMELPAIVSTGRRSIVVLASDTEDEPDHGERSARQRNSPAAARSPRNRDRRQSSVVVLGGRENVDHSSVRLSKPQPLRLFQSQTDHADNSDMYQSQEDVVVVGGSLEFKQPSSLEESEPGSQGGFHSPTLSATDAKENQPYPEHLDVPEGDPTLTPDRPASQPQSPPREAPHQSRKRSKALAMGIDEFARYPQQLAEQGVAKAPRREDTGDDRFNRHLEQFTKSFQSSDTASSPSPSTLQPPQQRALNAGQKHRQDDYRGDVDYRAWAEGGGRVGEERRTKEEEEEEAEEEEERLVDSRTRRSSMPSPAKKTRLHPPMTRFIIPKEPPRVAMIPSTLQTARPDLVRDDTIESFSSFTQSQQHQQRQQQLSYQPDGFGRSSMGDKLAEEGEREDRDEIEPFSDDEPTIQARTGQRSRQDQGHDQKTRRYSALQFADRPAALGHHGGSTSVSGNSGQGSSRPTTATASTATITSGAVGRREPCPLCGKSIPISELGSHVEREVAEQERQEREAQEQRDAEFAMTLGYQSQEDFVADDGGHGGGGGGGDATSSAEFSSQVLDSSQESLPSSSWLRRAMMERGGGPMSDALSKNNNSNRYNRPTQSGLAYLTQAPTASQEASISSVPARRRLGGGGGGGGALNSVAQSQQTTAASEDSPSRRIQQLSLQSPPPNRSRPLFSASTATSGASAVDPPAGRKLPVWRGAGGIRNAEPEQPPKPEYIEIDDDDQYPDDQNPIVIASQPDSDSGRLPYVIDSVPSSYSQMAFGIQPGQILPVDSDVATLTQSSYGGGGSSLFSRQMRTSKEEEEEEEQEEEEEGEREAGQEEDNGVRAVEQSQSDDEHSGHLDQELASISLEARDSSPDTTRGASTTKARATRATRATTKTRALVTTTTEKAKRPLRVDFDVKNGRDQDDDDEEEEDDDFVHQPAPASMINRPFRTTKPRHAAAAAATTSTVEAAAAKEGASATKKKQPKPRATRATSRSKKMVNLDSTEDEEPEDKPAPPRRGRPQCESTTTTAAATKAATGAGPAANRKKTSVLDSLLPTGVSRHVVSKGARATKNNNTSSNNNDKGKRKATEAILVVASQDDDDNDDDDFNTDNDLTSRRTRQTGTREKLWNPEDDLSDAERLDRRQVMGIGVGGIVGGVGAVPGRVTMSKLVRDQRTTHHHQRPHQQGSVLDVDEEEDDDGLTAVRRADRPQSSSSQELSTRVEYVGADGELEYGFHGQEWWANEPHQPGGGGAGLNAHHPVYLDHGDDDYDDDNDNDDGYMSPLEEFEGLDGGEGGHPIVQFFEEFDAAFQAPSGRRRKAGGKAAAATAAAAAEGGGGGGSSSAGGASRGKGRVSWQGRGQGVWRGRYAKGSSAKGGAKGGAGGSRRGRGRATNEGGNVHQMLFGRGIGPILDPSDPITANFRPSGR